MKIDGRTDKLKSCFCMLKLDQDSKDKLVFILKIQVMMVVRPGRLFKDKNCSEHTFS